MVIHNFTVLEQTPLLLALASVLLCIAFSGIAICASLTHSMQTTIKASFAMIACLITAPLLLTQYGLISPIGKIWHEDVGLEIALSIVMGCVCMCGVHDRVRLLARVFCAVGVALLGAQAQLWLIGNVVPNLAPFTQSMALIGTSAVALLAFSAATKPHSGRFNSAGALRLNALHNENWMLASYFVLAIAISLLMWRMKAFGGVNTAFHVYAGLCAAFICAISCMVIARSRRFALTQRVIAQALVAGVIWAAMCVSASPDQIIAGAIIISLGVVLTNQALISLTIDEPSGLVASIALPIMMSWLMLGLADVAQLAMHVKLIGCVLLIGAGSGLILRILCMISIGYSDSSRRLREGMDAIAYPLAS